MTRREATNGADGFAMATSRQPQLRGDAANLTIKRIALSANALDKDIARGPAAGFDKYLAKPLRLRDFLEAIADLAEDRPMVAPLGAKAGAVAP